MSTVRHTVHESLRGSFVPLPSDPTTTLSEEQLEALFGNPSAFRDVVKVVLEKNGTGTVVAQEKHDDIRSA